MAERSLLATDFEVMVAAPRLPEDLLYSIANLNLW